MKAGIFANGGKDVGYMFTEKVEKAVRATGMQPLLYKLDKGMIFDETIENEAGMALGEAELIVSIGGDGTFIKAANLAYKRNIPVLGINLGKLGFITEVEVEDIDAAIERLANGEYHIEKRIMLHCNVYRDGKLIYEKDALNEFFVAPPHNNRFIKLNIYIDDLFLDSYLGDGVIVATPTGSSAYALSAGGPIVKPDTEIIVTVPICPHTIYSRPFITSGDETIKILIDEITGDEAAIWGDGHSTAALKPNDSVEIKKSRHNVNIIRLEKSNFFKILRSKIYRREESFVRGEK